MRLGMLLGVRENRNDQGGFFQGAGTAGSEIIVALALSIIFGPFMLFFLGLAVWKMWPTWDEVVAFAILIGLFLVGIAWLTIWLRGHWAMSTARVNRAKVIHETEQGTTFVHEGEVIHHSHALPAPIYGDMEEEEIEAEPEFDYPKTFDDLVKDGYIAPGADYVIAFDPRTGEAIRLANPTSLGIGGVQGSGKTVTTLSLMLQSVTRTNGGVKFLVVDPHMNTAGDESLVAKAAGLSPFFLTIDQIRATVPPDDQEYLALLNANTGLYNPVSGGPSLETWMKIVGLEMDRRLHGKVGDPWIIVIDEFASVMKSRVADAVSQMIETINQEARKMNMFAFLISQEWKGTRTGGTELRHSIASFVVHNMPPAIAELIVPFDVARKSNTLTTGEVLVWTMGPARQGMVPYTNSQHVAGILMYYSPRENNVRKATEANNTQVVAPADYIGQGSLMVLPTLPQLETVQVSPGGDGLPMGVDKEKVGAIFQAWVEGLNQQDIATRVFGSRSAWALTQVRDTLTWMMRNGYRG